MAQSLEVQLVRLCLSLQVREELCTMRKGLVVVGKLSTRIEGHELQIPFEGAGPLPTCMEGQCWNWATLG